MNHKKLLLLLAATASTAVAYQEASASTWIEASDAAVNPYAPNATLQPIEEVRVVASADLPIVNNLSDLNGIIFEGMTEFATEITVRYQGDVSDIDYVMGIMKEIIAADDYLLGTVSSYGYETGGYVGDVTLTITLSYHTTAAQEAFVQSEVKRLVGELIRPTMSDVEKVRIINEWIVKKTTYSKNTKASPHAAYTILAEGKGVCQAYALLAYLMLEEAGVEARYVTGYAKEDHAWNLVKVDGEWYHLDPTWNDPVWNVPQLELGGFFSYKYFLISDQEIMKDHKIDAREGLPSATSERFNAVRNVLSTLFMYNNTPYVLIPEYVDGKLYYVDYQKNYVINQLNLLADTPTVKPFAAVRAMDIIATNEHLYFVDLDNGMDVSRLDLQTKELVKYDTGYKITSFKKDEHAVYGYSGSKLVFEEEIRFEPELEPKIQVIINKIATLDDQTAGFLDDVVNTQSLYDALTDAEKALVRNVGQLQQAQVTATAYRALVEEIQTDINVLNKEMTVNQLQQAIDAIETKLDKSAASVRAEVDNLAFWNEIKQYVAEIQNPNLLTMKHVYPAAEITDPMKTWTVKFSLAVDANSITEDNLFIVDNENQRAPLSVKVDGNKIIVTPTVGYRYDETYTMYILSSVRSTSGKQLGSTKFEFTVKSPEQMGDPTTFALTNDLQAVITNKDEQNFALALRVGDWEVGGYETAVGKTVGGRIIGQSGSGNKIETQVMGDRRYYYLYDVIIGKLRAVYWEDNNASLYFEEANKINSIEANATLAQLNVLLTNEFRVKNNVAKLAIDYNVSLAAYNHSQDMAQQNYFSHTSLDGRSVSQRVKVLCSNCTYIGENIAAGQRNIFLAHHAWINSAGHRENMLIANYTHLGTGIYYEPTITYRPYYTTDFVKVK